MKLRIARVGTFRANVADNAPVAAAGNNVPSPTIESMIESVSKPLDRTQIVKQEIAFGDKPAPSTPKANPHAPEPPDMGEYIRKQKRS